MAAAIQRETNLALALADLTERIRQARIKHPTGASLMALQDEIVEVACEEPGTERERSELLDVATVAMRMYLGERDVD